MTDIRFAFETLQHDHEAKTFALLLKDLRSRGESSRGVRYQRADGVGAMPSARALLVASLLTEPPYGCLGPSGNDRYRKRSLRSQTVGGFASQLPKWRRLFRNESATTRCVRAGAIG